MRRLLKIGTGFSIFALGEALVAASCRALCVTAILTQSSIMLYSQSEEVKVDGALVCNRVRYFPAPGKESAMVGGRICGSNVNMRADYEVLAEIKSVPTPGEWNELVFPNKKPFRWLRYEAPNGSYGVIAEIEFYSGKRKIPLPKNFGSFGWVKVGQAWGAGIDGNPNTFFQSDEPDGAYVGADLLDFSSTQKPVFSPNAEEMNKFTRQTFEVKGMDFGTNVGLFTERNFPLEVALRCSTPGAVIRYSESGVPGKNEGEIYTGPIKLDRPKTIIAVACKDGLAPSPVSVASFYSKETIRAGLSSFSIGNSLTGSARHFSGYLRTAGILHRYYDMTIGGSPISALWNICVEKNGPQVWDKILPQLPKIDHLTLQTRMAPFTHETIAKESVAYLKFMDAIRACSPEVQTWLYAEWPSRKPDLLAWAPMFDQKMASLYPALTWEEAASGYLFVAEMLKKKILESAPAGKTPRVLPVTLTMIRLKNLLDQGRLPGMGPKDFDPAVSFDNVHPGPIGQFVLCMTWYSAFYRQSPEGKIAPLNSELNPAQTKILQAMVWDVVKNYPDCGLYEEGKIPVDKPEFSAPVAAPEKMSRATLTSTTPGAWFRYTADGTVPSRTNGYVYSGMVTAPLGTTIRAVAYKSGMADSPVSEMTLK